jgi:3-oxoacyl-[acyl-carrier-protein] synthase II
MRRRVVITGLGSVSPLGLNSGQLWQASLEGVSGCSHITKFNASEFSTQIAAEIKGFDPEKYFDKKDIRRLDPFAQYAIVSAREAIGHSGLDLEKEDKNRIGVIVGSGTGGMFSFENEFKKLLEFGPKRISPYFIIQFIADIVSGLISIEHGLKGPNYATVSACATSGHAIGEAFHAIRNDRADVMVCGGTEAAITPMGVGGFNAMKAISTDNDNPAGASRPFDLHRNGFVMGEGAGIVVLEEFEHAKKRAANIIAELAGVGFTADAFHLTQPAPGGEGAVRVMHLALTDAGLSIDDIDYINAHGTSTPYNDKNETIAIKSVFGERAYKIPISSTKSMTGHLLGAAGAVELIETALAVKENKIPPTINYNTPDPDCDLNYTPNKTVNHEIKAAISNAFGFGGHNACICVKKYQE